MDDSFRPLSLGTTSGSMTKDFVFLGGKRIAFVSLASGNAYYYLTDHLGSTAVISSGDGKTIQWEADYFPFGAQRQVFTSSVNNAYQFTGYEYDSDTQYNYAVARFDAGRWGRFLSPDCSFRSIDLANPQSINRYTYVLNNPLNMPDPLGLDEEDAVPDPCKEWNTTCFVEDTNDSNVGGGNTWSCGDGCLGINVLVSDSSPPPPPDWSDLPSDGLSFVNMNNGNGGGTGNGQFGTSGTTGTNVVGTYLTSAPLQLRSPAGCTYLCYFSSTYIDQSPAVGIAHFSASTIDTSCGPGGFCPTMVLTESDALVSFHPRIFSCVNGSELIPGPGHGPLTH